MQASITQTPFTAAPMTANRVAGGALIALAVGFNLPFIRLAQEFGYPDILRESPETILSAFAAGGPSLILIWYAFALAAILFMPVAMGHALVGGRMARVPALAVAAMMFGVLAGLLQAMGLLRWVMVVPGLAASGDVQGFALIHAYAGVGLGEHLGQLLTAMYAAVMGVVQWTEGRRVTAGLAALTTISITVGAFEGVALAMGAAGETLGLFAVAGYSALSIWMIGSGIGLIRR